MDRDALPDAVEMIGVAAGKRVNRGAVGGIDDENATDRRFAVVGHKCARRHDVDRILLGAVEMDAMIAVMFGAGRQNVFFVERVDDVQHGISYRKFGRRGWSLSVRPRESWDAAVVALLSLDCCFRGNVRKPLVRSYCRRREIT